MPPPTPLRPVYFLLPGTGKRFACGGLWAELLTYEVASNLCTARLVTYRERENDKLFLDDVLADASENPIFIVNWGWDVGELLTTLKGRDVVYHAHSAGYDFHIPPEVPIFCVSRSTLGYWGAHAANSPLYYVPNLLPDRFANSRGGRDIDVLVQARKTSEYVLQRLVPSLATDCQIKVVTEFIEDLPALLNRTKVYLYESSEYWANRNVTEGFGLPPLEALACGCSVFSSVNHGLADYLEPGINCFKLRTHSLEWDRSRVLEAVRHWDDSARIEPDLSEYRASNVEFCLRRALEDVNRFFDYSRGHPPDIPPLGAQTKTWLRRLTSWRAPRTGA